MSNEEESRKAFEKWVLEVMLSDPENLERLTGGYTYRVHNVQCWWMGWQAGRVSGMEGALEKFVIELAGIYGLDEFFLRALPTPTLEMWTMLVRTNAKQHESERQTMERFRKELCELKFGAVRETGWVLLKDADENGFQYITVSAGMLEWSRDPGEALRLARRADADKLAEIVEDCDRIEEHCWPELAASPPQAEREQAEHKCKHCGEEIRLDQESDWVDRETFSVCEGTNRKHEPLPSAPLFLTQSGMEKAAEEIERAQDGDEGQASYPISKEEILSILQKHAGRRNG